MVEITTSPSNSRPPLTATRTRAPDWSMVVTGEFNTMLSRPMAYAIALGSWSLPPRMRNRFLLPK